MTLNELWDYFIKNYLLDDITDESISTLKPIFFHGALALTSIQGEIASLNNQVSNEQNKIMIVDLFLEIEKETSINNIAIRPEIKLK